MAGETNTNRIAKLEQSVAALVERVDNLRRDLGRMEVDTTETTKLLQDVDKRLALAVREVERLEKKVDDLLARRWELWKLFLAAFLGSILTVAAGFVSKRLEQWTGGGSGRGALATSAPGSVGGADRDTPR